MLVARELRCGGYESSRSTSQSSTAALTLEATETNGVWAPYTLLDTTPGQLYGVSCPVAGACTAVGTLIMSSGYNGVAYTETSGGWGPATVFEAGPKAPNADAGNLFSVSCNDASDCTAGGFDGAPMYAKETAGVWGAATEDGNASGAFFGMSCADAADCTAVGGVPSAGFYTTTGPNYK